jgi:hypothetical protein
VTALGGPLRTGVAARTVDLVVAWSVFSSQSVPRSELESLMHEFGFGAENPVTSCDLDILVHETAEVALGSMEP